MADAPQRTGAPDFDQEVAEVLASGTSEGIQETYRSVIAANAATERFSTWLLAAAGAGVALVVANLESVARVISRDLVRASLWLLLGSVLAGVVAKVLALYIETARIIEREMRTRIAPITEEHTEWLEELETRHGKKADRDQLLRYLVKTYSDAIVEVVPWWSKRRTKKAFERGIEDPKWALRKQIAWVKWASFAVALQLLALLGFVFVVEWGLR